MFYFEWYKLYVFSGTGKNIYNAQMHFSLDKQKIKINKYSFIGTMAQIINTDYL